MKALTDGQKFGTALFMCWFASYLERFLINMALPFIGAEYQLNEYQMGMLLSVFFFGYALVQIPGGYLADRFGSRKMILYSIVLFTLLSIGTGLAWSIASLFVVRFLFGLMEGCFPPAAYKAVAEQYKKTSRARVQSVMLATNPLSLFIAPLMAVPLITTFGWRGMFIVASLIGLAAFAAQLIWGGRRSAEAIENDADPAAKPEGTNWSALFRDSVIWKVTIINFGVNILIWGFLSWIPTYMLKVLKLDLQSVGFIASLPGIAGFIGILAGGWFADKTFDGKEKHLLVASIVTAVAALCLMLSTHHLGVIILAQIVVAFSVKIAFIGLWAFPLKRIDAHNMGAASGIVNLGSQAAGVASPAIMGYMIVLGQGSYSMAFGFLAICAALSAVVAMTLPSARKAPASALPGKQEAEAKA